MSDKTENTSETQKAEIRPNRLISIVWILPIIALLTGLWILVDTIQKRGPVITIMMDDAEGIEINKTTVKVRNVEAGVVTEINLNKERNGVEVTVQMDAGTEDLLNQQTKFWVVKPRVGQSGISGLNTLLSGAYIEFSPGNSTKEARIFKLLPEPPVTSDQHSGLRLKLVGNHSKLLPIGNPILYHDITVGRIETAEYNPKNQKIHYQIFIDKPYDQLIGKNIHFWVTQGLDISTNSDGIKIRSGPLISMISGAISFEIPEGQSKGDEVKQNSTFELFSDVETAQRQASNKAVYYVAFFNQSVRGLNVGSPIEYQGIRIGSVAQMPYYAHNDSLNLLEHDSIPVLLQIEPVRMEINAQPQSQSFWARKIQQAISTKGLVAKLESNNMITGTLYVELGFDAKSSKAITRTYNNYPVIPSVSSGLAHIEQQLSSLLTKLNQLPLEETTRNLNETLKGINQLTKSINKLADNPDTQNLPKEINQTLRDLKKTLSGISPDSPLYKEIKETIDNVNHTLSTVQPIARTLNEEPNALIFNRSQKDPTPQGAIK